MGAVARSESAQRNAPMRLCVHVLEARGLPAIYLNGSSDPYVRLQLGKRRAKTTVVKRSLSPTWDEEFGFLIGDVAEELVVSVLNEDRYFHTDFLGRVKVPLSAIMETEDLSLGTAWYQLQPKSRRFRKKRRGEICLRIYLSVRNGLLSESQNVLMRLINDTPCSSTRSIETTASSLSAVPSSLGLSTCASMDRALFRSSSMTRLIQSITDQKAPSGIERLPCGSTQQAVLLEPEEDDGYATTNASSVVEVLSRYFRKGADTAPSVTSDPETIDQFQDTDINSESCENGKNGTSEVSLTELLKTMEAKDQGCGMPGNLPGGTLVDQSYVIAPAELGSMLFSANSDFWPAVAEVQGLSGFQIDPWKYDNNDNCLKRTLTYTKAASKLVKSVKATEEQTYLKAAGNSYAVLSSVSTPDVPCGNCFKVEILYCIIPGPQLPSEEQTSQLTISWRLNFVQSTMLKGMIENGTKQGLREGYAQFTEVLNQKIKIVEPDDANSSKEKILASLETHEQSNWKLVARFLGSFAFLFSSAVAMYGIAHLRLAKASNMVHGLEIFGIDLPDSIGEVVFCAILILQGQNIFKVCQRFLHAWKQRGSDHGVKAHGDGWLLTVALIEGSGVIGAGTPGLPDPYVVFTCNGKRKTSSVKFQTSEPKWNEIFEFDAMDDAPSRLDVVVHDSDGPLDETTIGRTEVNFVKNNLSDLGDMWLPLDGRFSQGSEPKLHLRIFLSNSRGTEVVMNYLEKMGKEVGKKMHLRSAQTNSSFRKLFSLPPEEFLIDDFTCHLKRKMPLQGRLFLSSRIIGFYSNLFGRKTKFFFLWEDIDDIQVVPPSLSTVGSPSLMIILQKDRGLEARHGAKTLDPQGRLKFHFQTFVSFNDAHRIIMALWKMRSSGLEHKGEMVEKEPELKQLPCEECSLLSNGDVKMSEVYSAVLSVDVNTLMEMFSGGPLEHKVMQKAGCVDYSPTEWEPVNQNTYQRHISFRFDKSSSKYGGEATTTQKKYNLQNREGWALEEVMTLQGVLHEDYSSIQLKYHMMSTSLKANSCNIQVMLGIAWLKGTKHQKKATKNVMSNSANRLKEMFSEVEKELTSRKGAS